MTNTNSTLQAASAQPDADGFISCRRASGLRVLWLR